MYSTNPKSYEKFMPASPSPILYDIAESTTCVPVIPATAMHVKSSQPLTVKHKKERGPWSTGLCDCSSDCRNCCITFWCPCITFGQVAEIVDRGSSSCGSNGALYTLVACVTGFSCFYSCFYRTKMRQHYGLKESLCCDCLVHCCCEYCALCQEYRELKFRGYDMAIGWHGNLEKRHREATMAPMVEEGMAR